MQQPRAWTALACGVVLGLAALTRSVLWPFPLVLCPMLAVLVPGTARSRIVLPLVLLSGFCLAIGPWVVRNTRLQGVFTVVDTMGGLNLRMGNYEHTPEDRMWDAVALEGEKNWSYALRQERPGEQLTEGQKDKWAQGKAVEYMVANPGVTLRRSIIKFSDFWGLEREYAAGIQQGLFRASNVVRHRRFRCHRARLRWCGCRRRSRHLDRPSELANARYPAAACARHHRSAHAGVRAFPLSHAAHANFRDLCCGALYVRTSGTPPGNTVPACRWSRVCLAVGRHMGPSVAVCGQRAYPCLVREDRLGVTPVAQMAMEPGIDRGLPNPIDPSRRIRAVLFDLDGTLYRQAPVRALMALELLTLPLTRPSRTAGTLRALRAYREAQERLRGSQGQLALADAQIMTAAELAGLGREEVEQIVNEWMQQRPLKYLRAFRAAGTTGLLDLLQRAGLPAGLLSDYPAQGKLQALGLAGRFSPVLCSTDPDIDAFKPDPRGFLHACDHWNLPPSDVLVIGDRHDVDVAGALAARMPCALIGRAPAGITPIGYVVFPSLERLASVLDGN